MFYVIEKKISQLAYKLNCTHIYIYIHACDTQAERNFLKTTAFSHQPKTVKHFEIHTYLNINQLNKKFQNMKRTKQEEREEERETAETTQLINFN